MSKTDEIQTQRKLQPEFHAAMQRIQPLLVAAEAGDDVAMAELRAYFDDNPSIWQHYSDFMGDAESTCIEAVAEGTRLGKELWRKRVDNVRQGLLEPSTSPLERMLIDRIAICWLQVQQAEINCFLQMGKGGSLKNHAYNEQRLDRAQTRYLSAVKSLAQVRRLQRPQRLNVNIAENQINVAELHDRPPRAIEARPDGAAGSVSFRG